MNHRFYSGKWGKCHCQGIALDREKKYIYYSFTTKLVKCTLDGGIVGTVDNIVGHLGCIAFNDADGRLYASLEYKNDSIGRGILSSLGYSAESLEDSFYIAIFDVDRIDRMDMNAEEDGVMRVVYLPTVVADYNGSVENNGAMRAHLHGCSGIDGVTFGPDFGAAKDSTRYLHVAYGVYSDLERTDNDYQVLLQYDASAWWDTLARPLTQRQMHHEGPAKPRNKYFVYTGNTTYGIQNLEYDPYSGNYFAAVYRGKKTQFPNYSLFCIDGAASPRREVLRGCDGLVGDVLTLARLGCEENGIYGSHFPYGSIGLYSMGDGSFYVGIPDHSDRNDLAAYVLRHRLVAEGEMLDLLPMEE